MDLTALFLDEDVRLLLAEVLRRRGYDVLHTIEAGRQGEDDQAQLEFATAQGRILLTHNVRDHMLLDRQFREENKMHSGILLSDQLPFRELLRRTLKFLNSIEGKEVEGRMIWLHTYK